MVGERGVADNSWLGFNWLVMCTRSCSCVRPCVPPCTNLVNFVNLVNLVNLLMRTKSSMIGQANVSQCGYSTVCACGRACHMGAHV